MNLPVKYKEYYERLKKRNPDMSLVFERNECCEKNSEELYSIPDWYESGHYWKFECKACGHKYWEDEIGLGFFEDEDEDEED